MNISLKSCEEIYNILENISKDEKKIKSKKIESNSKIDISILVIGIILFIYAFIIKFIIFLTSKTEPLENTLFFLVMLGYLLIIISPIVGLMIEIKKNYKNIKNSLKILFKRTRDSTEADINAVRKLIYFNQDNLDFSYIELKHELEDFNKRIANIVGTISKIGLFPAILVGLTAISTQLEKKKFILQNLEPLNQYIVLFSISIIILYFVSLHANFKSSDLERRVKILEYVIQLKKNKKDIIHLI